MINLPKLSDFPVLGKRVIVRADVDLGDEIREGDEVKLKTIVPTLEFLIQKDCKIIIIGHRGRPDGVKVDRLSLKPVSEMLARLLNKNVNFVDEVIGEKASSEVGKINPSEIIMLENTRFDPREETNDDGFARALASLGEVYVNEAFSASHREHASVVGIPKLLPHAAGLRFVEEVEHLSRVTDNPERPLVFLISGVKKDKLEMIEEVKKLADKVLVAGRLPDFMENYRDEKVVVAQLNPDKEDITIRTIERFSDEIEKAATIVLAGVIGKYEDEGHRQGTKEIFETVANSQAYKVAGGGDTEQAIGMFGLENKFDWISVGGGASLEFLAKGTLPGIEALLG